MFSLNGPVSREDGANGVPGSGDGDGLCDYGLAVASVCIGGWEDVDQNGTVGLAETDPNVADTDGDGFDDGVEVAAGTDPLDDQSFPMPVVPVLPLAGWFVLAGALALAGRGRARSAVRGG